MKFLRHVMKKECLDNFILTMQFNNVKIEKKSRIVMNVLQLCLIAVFDACLKPPEPFSSTWRLLLGHVWSWFSKNSYLLWLVVKVPTPFHYRFTQIRDGNSLLCHTSLSKRIQFYKVCFPISALRLYEVLSFAPPSMA